MQPVSQHKGKMTHLDAVKAAGRRYTNGKGFHAPQQDWSDSLHPNGEFGPEADTLAAEGGGTSPERSRGVGELAVNMVARGAVGAELRAQANKRWFSHHHFTVDHHRGSRGPLPRHHFRFGRLHLEALFRQAPDEGVDLALHGRNVVG
jgi:hypothetical protein